MTTHDTVIPHGEAVSGSSRPAGVADEARKIPTGASRLRDDNVVSRERFSWARLKQMIKKEMLQLARDPKSRPLLFVVPIVQMLLVGSAVTTDVKDIRTAIVDQDHTVESRALVNAYQSAGYFKIVMDGQRAEDLPGALARGEITVGLTIPPGFARDMRSGHGAVVQTLIDGSDASLATVAQSYAGAVASAFGARTIGARPEGVELRSRAWFNPSLESRFFNVPAIMAVLLMMICLIITALGVVREREIGTFDQLLVSPITPTELILGKTIPVLGLGSVHLVIYVSLMGLYFGVPMRGAYATLLLAAYLYIATALALGLLISTVSRTQQEAFMLLVLFLLPSVVLSGFLSPVESMPQVFQWIAALDPLRYFLDITRGVFLKGIGLAELWPKFLALALMLVTAFTFATRRFGKMIA